MAVDIDELRALVLDEDENVFTDEALEAAIAGSGDSLLRAAGLAFTSLAAQYAVLGKSVKTDDLGIDTRSRGKDLNEVALSFFKQADAADVAGGNDYFDIVGFGGRASSCHAELVPCPVGCSCCGVW